MSARVRLLPAVMVTLGVVLSLKAAALAEEAAGAAGSTEAKSTAAPTPEATTAASDPKAGEESAAPTCPAPSFADQAGLSPAEVQVLQSLGDRRRAIEARAADIESRGAILEAAEKRLDERIAELKRLEGDVKGLLGQLDEAEAARIDTLVAVYQRMRAKDAAQVFDGLEEDVLLQVAQRMRQQNLAEIMGLMAPDRARKLTVMLAQSRRPSLPGAGQLGAPSAPPPPPRG